MSPVFYFIFLPLSWQRDRLKNKLVFRSRDELGQNRTLVKVAALSPPSLRLILIRPAIDREATLFALSVLVWPHQTPTAYKHILLCEVTGRRTALTICFVPFGLLQVREGCSWALCTFIYAHKMGNTGCHIIIIQ